MIGSFKHKGARRDSRHRHDTPDGTANIGKCVRILQLLEVAGQPEDMNIVGFRFQGLRGKPPRWAVRVTGNYRISFGWAGENALDIDLEGPGSKIQFLGQDVMIERVVPAHEIGGNELAR